jgi:multidrug efflux pump
LERQFGELPGLGQMTSSSSFGASVITLQFDLEENIDVAEQEVQAAINAAQTYLPSDLPNPPIYSKVNPADAPILTLALTSDSMPLPQVEDLADTTWRRRFPSSRRRAGEHQRRPKAGGAHQANPTALASYGMSLEELRTAIGQANVDQAKGQARR